MHSGLYYLRICDAATVQIQQVAVRPVGSIAHAISTPMPRVARRTRTPRRRRSRVIRRVARRVRRRTLRKQAVTQNSYRRQAVSDPRATARIKVDYEFVFSNYHLDGIPHTNSSLYAVNLLEVLRTSDKFVDMMQNYE